MSTETVPRTWLAVAGALTLLELFFLYEAMLADATGYQKVFGIFLGLGIFCFAALLYLVTVVFYDWSLKEN